MFGGELASVWLGGAIGGGVGGFLGDGSGQYVLIGSNVGSNNVSLIDVITGNTSGTYRKDGIDRTELAISTELGLILGGTGSYLAKENVPSSTAGKLVPDNLASQVAEHNSQIGILNRKQGTISGAHKQDAFLESVEMTGAKINLTITDKSYPGLIEYKYQIPAVNNKGQQIGFKSEQTKTTYDPQILSNSKVTDMSNKAAQQAENYFKANPSNRQYSVKIDGYWFQVTRDAKTGQINNAFITMPPRGSK